MSDIASITIEPKCALIDQKVSIKVLGLKANNTVTIRAQSLDYYKLSAKNSNPNHWKWIKKTHWESFGVFKADSNGNIDLSTQKPTGGTYNAVDSMGLLWSMNYKTKKNYNLSKQLPFAPLLKSMTVRFIVESNGKQLASTECKRLFYASKVKLEEVSENGIVGRYFNEVTTKLKPGVIVVSGSEGGIDNATSIAGLLSSHGYATLALAYFNMEGLPKSLNNVPLEYFENAIKWINQRGDIDPNNLTIFGRSRGGELALLLGSTFKELTSVIAVSPSPILFQCRNKSITWKYKNMNIPFLKLKINVGFFLISAFFDIIHKRAIDFSKVYLKAIKNYDDIKEKFIPIQKINGPILFISGKYDNIWPSQKLCQFSVKRLAELKFPFKYKILNYEAGHYIYYPYIPVGDISGITEKNAYANKDAWKNILIFLDGQRNKQ